MIIPVADRLQAVEEYYFSTKLREIRRRIAEGQDIINLGIGSPDLPPSPEVLETLIQAAENPRNHAYQPYKGIQELRNSFCSWYDRTFRVEIDPDTELLPLMGSKEGIMHISNAFLNPGDEVLVPNPGYPTYSSVAKLLGAKVRYYDLSDEHSWYPNLEALGQEDMSRVKIMWINYPHMPTGMAGNISLFDRLIEFAKTHKVLLVNDNPYSLVLNPNPLSLLSRPGAKDVAIELNSLSKSHNMAGWRIGMVAGASSYIQYILTVKSNMDSGMFLPLQLAAAKALLLETDWHQQRNEVYRGRRELGWEILETLGCKLDKEQVGMFLWAKLPQDESSSATFSDRILDSQAVFLTPGFIFGHQGEGYIRLSLCKPQERLEEALARIQRV